MAVGADLTSEVEDRAGLLELREAIAMTCERNCPRPKEAGKPRAERFWCPPATGRTLKRMFLSLGPTLPGLARQAVRLARVLEHEALRGGYAVALFDPHPMTRARFAQRFEQAQRDGRLAGIAVLNEARLELCEPSMAGAGGKPFSLLLGALPGVAAYLDMVHNMLGYAAVQALLAPALGPLDAENAGTGEAVGAALARAVDQWVRPRLQESQYEQRQARLLSDFLHDVARRHGLPGRRAALGDEAILEFWLTHGAVPKPENGGFRQFRTVARSMLRFRRSLHHEATEKALLGESRNGSLSLQVLSDAIDLLHTAPVTEDFRAPLPWLQQASGARVKWLTGAQRDQLSTWFETATDGQERRCLFVGEPPDPRFVRTVLRTVCFGTVQSVREIEGLPGPAPAGRAGTATPGAGYLQHAEEMSALLGAVEEAVAAAAGQLARSGSPAAITLLELLEPDGVEAWLAALGEHADAEATGLAQDRTTALLSEALVGGVPALPEALARRLSAARRNLRRNGFRAEDLDDPEIVDSLAAGIEPMAVLLHWMRRVGRWLQAVELDSAHVQDHAVFHEAFSRRGAETAEPVVGDGSAERSGAAPGG